MITRVNGRRNEPSYFRSSQRAAGNCVCEGVFMPSLSTTIERPRSVKNKNQVRPKTSVAGLFSRSPLLVPAPPGGTGPHEMQGRPPCSLVERSAQACPHLSRHSTRSAPCPALGGRGTGGRRHGP